MAENWRIQDIIDLEYFLAATENGDKSSQADREAYLAYAQNRTPPFHRRRLIRHWVDARRAREKQQAGEAAMLPGRMYTESMRLLRLLSAGLAAAAGAGLAWRLLAYQGQQPINVFTCLWVLIAPQLLLLAALGTTAAAGRSRFIESFKLLYPLIANLIRTLFRWIRSGAESRAGAEKRQRMRAALGQLGRSRTIYGRVFLWPVFLTAQLIGVFFNLGVLAAMMLRVTITDLAFGWQSTLQPDAETVYGIIDAISLPWSWLTAPPVTHPTLEQIAGSQMILKDGIYRLATGDLVAWWPFLCFSVLFYGLLPRVLLLAYGAWRQKKNLDRLDFAHAACDRLVQRMQTPRIETASRPYDAMPGASDPTAPEPDLRRESTAVDDAAMVDALVFIPADIRQNCADDEIARRLRTGLAMTPAEIIAAEIDVEADGRALRRAQTENSEKASFDRLVIVMEAWQPPIRETLNWIRAMRQRLTHPTGIVIALIGKPANGTIFTRPAEADCAIWQQAIDGIGDAYLRVERLGD